MCRPQLIDELEGKISLDADFYGFTSLHSSEKDSIAAESVCPQSYISKLIYPLQCRSCNRARGPCLWLLDAFSYTPSHADVAARLSTRRDPKYSSPHLWLSVGVGKFGILD